MIENPQPVWLPLLLLFLPGIGFSAYALNKALFPEEDRPICTIPALGIVLALLPTHLLALAFASLSVGLVVAWSVVGAAGYAWTVAHWRELRFSISVRHPGWAYRVGIAALVSIPIVLPTILLNFHDETFFNGHHAIIAHLQNGSYPPRYLYEPSLPLRYHYGFDLAAAIVTGVLRLRLDQAVDLLTLALWPCMFLLLWRVGDHVGGPSAGLLIALVVCYSAGGCSLCTVNGLRTNPPLVSYFFQHPWSIGVPLFCLIVLQRAALPRINTTIGLIALVCSLLLLSLSQAVLFVTTITALTLAESWHLVRSRDRTAATVLLAVGIASIGAKLVGGFFISAAYPPDEGLFHTAIELRHYISSSAILDQAEWNIGSFGLLSLGIFGVFRARNDSVFLITLGAISLVIANLLRHKYNWDIVKFAVVASMVMAIGFGLVLSGLAEWAKTWLRKTIRALLAIAVLWQGVYYAFFFLLAYSPGSRPPFSIQMIRPYFSLQYPVDSDNAAAASFLRTHMEPSELVYRTPIKAEPYAIWAGLPTPVSAYSADSGDNDQFGLGQTKFAARKALTRITEDWLDRLLSENVTWVVADDEDDALNAVLTSPEGRQRAALVAQYGRVRILHLK